MRCNCLYLCDEGHPASSTLQEFMRALCFCSVAVAQVLRLAVNSLRACACSRYGICHAVLHREASECLELLVDKQKEVSLAVIVPFLSISCEEVPEPLVSLLVELSKVTAKSMMPIILRTKKFLEARHLTRFLTFLGSSCFAWRSHGSATTASDRCRRLWPDISPQLVHVDHHRHGLVKCDPCSWEVLLFFADFAIYTAHSYLHLPLEPGAESWHYLHHLLHEVQGALV
mmetsp:Transcript_902/g.1761  ORF Transcript_902/g.1761 Transcript_902/m.1761 type:complete len:229 (+) Transcript_902:217-903(+)